MLEKENSDKLDFLLKKVEDIIYGLSAEGIRRDREYTSRLDTSVELVDQAKKTSEKMIEEVTAEFSASLGRLTKTLIAIIVLLSVILGIVIPWWTGEKLNATVSQKATILVKYEQEANEAKKKIEEMATVAIKMARREVEDDIRAEETQKIQDEIKQRLLLGEPTIFGKNKEGLYVVQLPETFEFVARARKKIPESDEERTLFFFRDISED
jgi:biotin synthase-related radical SAM superfamily protein